MRVALTFWLLRTICTGMSATFSNSLGGVGVTPNGQLAIVVDAGNYMIRKVVLHQCANCSAGTYSNVTGALDSKTCILCPKDTYSAVLGANSLATCVPCAGNATAPAGSEVCMCKAGFVGPAGGPPCTICGRDSYSHVNSSTCQQCPMTASSLPGSTALSDCNCGAGAYVESGKCNNCSAGTFSNATHAMSSAACADCPIDTYSSEGSTVCLSCPGNASSQAASSACSCVPGFGGSGATGCTRCPVGTYNPGKWMLVFRQSDPFRFSAADDWAEARSLNAGAPEAPNFSILDQLEDLRGSDGTFEFKMVYPEDDEEKATIWKQSSNPVTRTSSGVEGYFLIRNDWGTGFGGLEKNGATGYAFLDGTPGGNWFYAIAVENPNNFPSATGQTTQVELYVSLSKSKFADTCRKCSRGTYSNSTGAAWCAFCPVGTYTNMTGASACASCPANSSALVAGSSTCTCNAGFSGPDGGPPCAICPRNFYSTLGSAACVPCFLGSVSPRGSAGQESCVCGADEAKVLTKTDTVQMVLS